MLVKIPVTSYTFADMKNMKFFKTEMLGKMTKREIRESLEEGQVLGEVEYKKVEFDLTPMDFSKSFYEKHPEFEGAKEIEK